MIFSLWEEMKQAWRALLSNKVRSFLTMLGVIIGIFSVITLVTIGEGAKTYITDQIKNLGAGYDSFALVAGKDMNAPPNPKFTYNDIAIMKSRIPEIKDIVAMNMGAGDLTYGKKKIVAPAVFGVTANYLDLMGGKLSAGRYFSPAEVEARRKVAVIGPTVAREFFGDSSPLGERVKLDGDQYLIIGVSEARGSIGPMDMDKRIVMPVTIVKNMFGNYNIMRFNIFPQRCQHRSIRSRKRSASGDATAFGKRRFPLYDPAGDPEHRQQRAGGADQFRRRHCRDLAAGRRHRHHEHHAGGGQRADTARSASARRSAPKAAISSCSSWSNQ